MDAIIAWLPLFYSPLNDEPLTRSMTSDLDLLVAIDSIRVPGRDSLCDSSSVESCSSLYLHRFRISSNGVESEPTDAGLSIEPVGSMGGRCLSSSGPPTKTVLFFFLAIFCFTV